MNQVRLVKRMLGVAVVGVGVEEKKRGVELVLLVLVVVDGRGWGFVLMRVVVI